MFKTNLSSISIVTFPNIKIYVHLQILGQYG